MVSCRFSLQPVSHKCHMLSRPLDLSGPSRSRQHSVLSDLYQTSARGCHLPALPMGPVSWRSLTIGFMGYTISGPNQDGILECPLDFVPRLSVPYHFKWAFLMKKIHAALRSHHCNLLPFSLPLHRSSVSPECHLNCTEHHQPTLQPKNPWDLRKNKK